ncbi:MAG: DUF4363 family protein [Dysosmobacter sp.]|nr:DUF4363 family protein [Dysosmobacter sp.]
MKKGLLFPAAVLAGLLAFCVWNSAAMSDHTTRWRAQLAEADRLAQLGDWGGTAAVIREGYADWSARQTYLHVVTSHDAVDGAEAMYHRALAFAESQEDSELRAELADLRDQLRLLAEMEEFSVRNVL